MAIKIIRNRNEIAVGIRDEDSEGNVQRIINFFENAPFVKDITIFNKQQQKIEIHSYELREKKTYGIIGFI